MELVSTIDMVVENISSSVANAVVGGSGDNEGCHLFVIYGPPYAELKDQFCTVLGEILRLDSPSYVLATST